MIKKNKWNTIFSSKKMSYYQKTLDYIKSQDSLLNIKSYNLCKIIYPGLTPKIYCAMKNFFSKLIVDNFGKKIKDSISILDFGSGNGFLLFFLLNKFNIKKMLSIELSKNLIFLQKKILHKTKFLLIDNNNTLFFNKVKDNSYDFVICCSVFQYFISYRYAIDIIENFIRIGKRKICLYDIKNFEFKHKYLKNLMDRQNISKSEFKKKYKFCPIRFYKKKFFLDKFSNIEKVKKIIFKKMPVGSLDQDFGYSVIIELN